MAQSGDWHLCKICIILQVALMAYELLGEIGLRGRNNKEGGKLRDWLIMERVGTSGLSPLCIQHHQIITFPLWALQQLPSKTLNKGSN